MALIKCSECGKDVSTTAAACANCGAKPKKPASKVWYWVIGIFVVGIAASRCSDKAPAAASKTSVSPSTLTANSASTTGPSPATALITKEERAKRVADILKGFKSERDKIEKVTFYTAAGTNVFGDHLSTYIGLMDGSGPVLRISVDFHADSWIFWNKFKVMSDDVIVYEKILGRSGVVRDNNSAGVFERADFFATQSDLAALQRIVSGKKSTIRLSGDEKQRDYELSPKAIKNITKTLEAYRALLQVPLAGPA